MDLKQSAANIVAWAKAHPWAAAAIIGVVILAAWYAAKSAGAGAGSSGQPVTIDAGSAADGPGQLGSLGGSASGGLGSVLGQLGDSASPTPSLPAIPSPAPSLTPGSMFEDLSYTPSPADSFLPEAITPLAGMKAGLDGAGTSLGSLGGRLMDNSHTRSVPAPAAPSVKPGKGIGDRVNVNNPLAKKGKNTANQTPAMALGKGRHFTGYINGMYYVNGYPVESVNVGGVSSVILPGGRAASASILGLSESAAGTTGSSSGRQVKRGR